MGNFPVLDTAGISIAGRIVIRGLIKLRETIVGNPNLVFRPGVNMNASKSVIDDNIEEIKEILEKFQRTPADVAEANVNGMAVVEELIAIQDELRNLLQYCKHQIANEPAAAAVAADQVRIERLHFPTFDGINNYKNWKSSFDALIPHVNREEVKKSHLLEALKGKAKAYIDSVITPVNTYAEIRLKLEERYNDPLVVNYNLLDRMFNSPDMAKPQSTQEHWDIAVGDINAILASGITLAEALVYYKLHKFPPETVKKVKVLHKIQFPGRSCINLVEAIKLMNEVTAEEVELTKDLVAVEQTLQGLTMTAVLKVIQATIPAVTPNTQSSAVAPNTQSPAVAPNTQSTSTPKKKNYRNY